MTDWNRGTIDPAPNATVDSKVINGATYFYKVSAYNAGGESARSLELAASPAPPFTIDALSTYESCGARPQSTGKLRRLFRVFRK